MNHWRFNKNSNSHNRYTDIKNKWAPSATERTDLSVLKFLILVLILLFLGSGSALLLINEWMQPAVPKSSGAYQDIIQPIIQKYEEKNSYTLINFASEINDARVLLNETSPFYHGWIVRYKQSYIYDRNHPSLLISDDNSLGRCWAFKGQQGYASIKLGYKVKPISFSIQHINVRY